MRWVLERPAAVGARGLREESALWGQAAMEFLHRVDGVAKMVEGIVRPENAHFTVAKRPARVEVGGNPAAVQIDRLVISGRVELSAKIDRPPESNAPPKSNDFLASFANKVLGCQGRRKAHRQRPARPVS
jgi:hypothetical protein